jgi:hypothetical protein
MNHEHEQDYTSSPALARAALNGDDDDDEVVEPGQSSRSAFLRKRDHAVASGLVQRKARDANGVADGAEHAVAEASSSSSAPLPDTLMRKFESSLGADLSGVRVHTGDASARAADAVGAKAYTVGNNIHFGAGHYDPASTGGQHLLAHEVAHTVQQSGGARRMQFKLEVSSPGDGLEHEADRAADAMVSGGAARVSGASGLSRNALLLRSPEHAVASGLVQRARRRRAAQRSNTSARQFIEEVVKKYKEHKWSSDSGDVNEQAVKFADQRINERQKRFHLAPEKERDERTALEESVKKGYDIVQNGRNWPRQMKKMKWGIAIQLLRFRLTSIYLPPHG